MLGRMHSHVSVSSLPIDGAGHLVANRQGMILGEAVMDRFTASHI
jgi:hypothetical protein